MGRRTRLAGEETQSGNLGSVWANLHQTIMRIGAVFTPIGETLIFASTQSRCSFKTRNEAFDSTLTSLDLISPMIFAFP